MRKQLFVCYCLAFLATLSSVVTSLDYNNDLFADTRGKGNQSCVRKHDKITIFFLFKANTANVNVTKQYTRIVLKVELMFEKDPDQLISFRTENILSGQTIAFYLSWRLPVDSGPALYAQIKIVKQTPDFYLYNLTGIEFADPIQQCATQPPLSCGPAYVPYVYYTCPAGVTTAAWTGTTSTSPKPSFSQRTLSFSPISLIVLIGHESENNDNYWLGS
ncbi:uncharacterized protein LOC142344971 [Convolutriloba macropyga]|uniref:uncharacterized protein LOC142344971 n=1 Tax=Convolutriloba macropyga TaxID=536237 RepID=UPI003F525609